MQSEQVIYNDKQYRICQIMSDNKSILFVIDEDHYSTLSGKTWHLTDTRKHIYRGVDYNGINITLWAHSQIMGEVMDVNAVRYKNRHTFDLREENLVKASHLNLHHDITRIGHEVASLTSSFNDIINMSSLEGVENSKINITETTTDNTELIEKLTDKFIRMRTEATRKIKFTVLNKNMENKFDDEYGGVSENDSEGIYDDNSDETSEYNSEECYDDCGNLHEDNTEKTNEYLSESDD